MNMIMSRHTRRAAAVAAIVVAAAVGALVANGRSTAAAVPKLGTAPATSTAALNARYTACIRSNGATWTPIANSGGMFRVDIPAAANANCESLDLAREAAGDGDAATADWLQRIGGAPNAFWACLDAAGFHVSGGTGQRSDYGSASFGETARACAGETGVTLPTR